MKRDVYIEITKTIAGQLAACKPWERPWRTLAGGLPTNATTGKPYRGINVLALCSRGYASPKWATYKQWESVGAQVRKGEKSSLIVKWKDFPIMEKGKPAVDDNGKPRKALVPLAACVFNVAQVDGFEAAPEEPAPVFAPHDRAERLMNASGAKIIYGGGRAFYRIAADTVHLPDRSAFKSADGFYSVAFHELGHWTGAEARCNRTFGKRFGDKAYAFEELVAELTAAFLCAHTGVNDAPREDHASYVAHWLEIMRGDQKAIFTAASRAQAAADFLTAFEAPALDIPAASMAA